MKAIAILLCFSIINLMALTQDAVLEQPVITKMTYDPIATRMTIEISEVPYVNFLYVWHSKTAMDLGNTNNSTLLEVIVLPEKVTHFSYLTEEPQGYFWVVVSKVTPLPL